MLVIKGLLPWILFWVLFALHKTEPAAVSAFLLTIGVLGYDRVKHYRIKEFQWIALGLFLVLSVLAVFTDLEISAPLVMLLSHVVLVITVALSIAFGRPFTLEYSREWFPKDKWDDAKVIRVNFTISRIWLAAFIFDLIVPVMKASGFKIPRGVGLLVSLINISAAVAITKLYVRRKNQNKAI